MSKTRFKITFLKAHPRCQWVNDYGDMLPGCYTLLSLLMTDLYGHYHPMFQVTIVPTAPSSATSIPANLAPIMEANIWRQLMNVKHVLLAITVDGVQVGIREWSIIKTCVTSILSEYRDITLSILDRNPVEEIRHKIVRLSYIRNWIF